MSNVVQFNLLCDDILQFCSCHKFQNSVHEFDFALFEFSFETETDIIQYRTSLAKKDH